MSHATEPTPLLSWIWRSYWRSALVPLLIIELVLVGIYLTSHAVSGHRTLETFRDISEQEFRNLAGQKAAVVSERLAGVATALEVFRHHATEALTTSCTPDEAEVARYAWSDEGVFHTAGRGGAALYYSNIASVGASQRMKAYCSARLDELMISLTGSSPLIDQIYVNTHDSMNRIYPWFDVTEQYLPHMDIPSFNFYYEADARNNPDRGMVWTEAYLDPAGRGWLISAIAPVYRGDFLEGVVGIDVTLSTVVDRVLQLDLPDGAHALLLGRNGRILALPRAAAEDWRFEPPEPAGDYGPVHSDTLQPDDLSLAGRIGMAGLSRSIAAADAGIAHIDLPGGARTAAWSPIEATGWTMLVVGDEGQVFGTVLDLTETFREIGLLMVGLLAVFSLGFFALLYGRARQHSQAIAEPLLGLREMARRIGRGEFRQPPVTSGIAELNQTGGEVARMGVALGEAHQRLLDADRELRRALLDARAANRARTEFLAKMSHELRTPLNAIIGFAELISDRAFGPEPDERYFEYAEDILGSGRHLLGIINDVLDLAKIETGQRQLSPVPIPVGQLFADVRATTAADVQARGLALEIELPPSLPALLADQRAARQIVLNLMSNAIKFSSGGVIRLGAGLEGEDRMALWVADPGIGIPEDKIEDVLKPFEQVEGAYARGHGGTGLGLTIVKDLVELHGGDIRIDSREGEGTTVTVRLPLRREAADCAPEAREAPAAQVA
jgi:signal transduction histidine kinase